MTTTNTTTTEITALSEKVNGNNHFKNLKYPSAVKAYTNALSLSPTPDLESQIRSNLALVYQKQSQYSLAEVECTKAMILDGNNSKLWYRRSQIRESLQNNYGALQDMKRCVELFELTTDTTTTKVAGYGTAKQAVERLENNYSEELLQKKRDAILKACEERIREKEMEAAQRERERLEKERREKERLEVEELTKQINSIQERHIIQTKAAAAAAERENIDGDEGSTDIIKKFKSSTQQQHMVKGNDDDDDNENESIEEKKDDSIDTTTTITTTTTEDAQKQQQQQQKKKRKKKKKKKTNNNSTNQQTTTTTTTTTTTKNDDNNKNKTRRHVSFGTVSAREYRRLMGGDGVPNDGGWPLGLSLHDIIREVDLGSVDDYDVQRRQLLVKRWEEVTGEKIDNDDETTILETRQFDYKKRNNRNNNSSRNGGDGTNPLFSYSSEKLRKVILCRDVNFDFVNPPPPPHSPPSSPTKNSSSAKSNSNSINNNNNNHHQMKTRSSRSNRRSRKNSFDDTTTTTSSMDHNNNNTLPYNSMEILHIQNELEQLRNHRTPSHQGCQCRKSTLHHGKHKKRTIPEKRLKDELRKRGMIAETQNKSRDEMEAILVAIMANEPCCRDDNNCPCIKNGIGCQADVCGCWQHQDKQATTLEDIINGCGSRLGMNVVNADAIGDYRKRFVTAKQHVPSHYALH